MAAAVFVGSSKAEEGRLRVVAAGADKAILRSRPLLEAFARRITMATDEPKRSHVVKLEPIT